MTVKRKTLGLIGHDYLKESGLLRLLQEFDIAMFAVHSSTLHELATYACPVPHIDLSDGEFLGVVKQAERRGIQCDGFLSMRDWNVCAAAKAAASLTQSPTLSPLGALERLRQKSLVRMHLNECLDPTLHTRVSYRTLNRDISKISFRIAVEDLLREGSVIIKPDRGSCSYYVFRIDAPEQIDNAWDLFKSASAFRGGTFIAERYIDGSEYPVDSIVSDKLDAVFVSEYISRHEGTFFERGIVFPSKLDQSRLESVRSLMEALHGSLELRQIVSHTELIFPEIGPPAIVEVNPRIAGDLMPELYRLVNGVEFYRIAGHLSLGRRTPAELLENGDKRYSHALIMFSPPERGILRLRDDPGRFLRFPAERFRLLFPEGTALAGGGTNDDRPAYVLTLGDSRAEVIERAERVLANCIHIEVEQ